MRLGTYGAQGANRLGAEQDVEEIITYCSHIFTLEPGDVIATATPGGIGFACSRRDSRRRETSR